MKQDKIYYVCFTSNIVWQTFIVTAILSLRLLLQQNMGNVNEVDVLPLARQYVDPTWIPQDWYLNQEAGYRFIFQSVIGWLIVNLGFLTTSIIGRLLCYALVAIGLVLIGKQLRLSLPFLVLALILFIYTCDVSHQGVIAQEWVVGGLEAKAFAYGFVLIAISFFLAKNYLMTAILLGCATSFHVLVGGWAFITCIGWFCIRPRKYLSKISQFIPLLLFSYITTSVFAIAPVWQQLSISAPVKSDIPSPSFIYVFLRLSHHLNPFSWRQYQWIELIIYLILLLGIMILLNTQFYQKTYIQNNNCCRYILGELALISLIPFLLGIIIAFFDFSGKWLQYYPFRFGDVMLPLAACLLGSCIIEDIFFKNCSKLFFKSFILLLTFILSLQFTNFAQQIYELKHFPSSSQGVSSDFKALISWIRKNTNKDTIFISSPTELPNFTWLTERPTIVKFKLLPQTKERILEYYQRLDDLSGNNSLSNYLKSGNLSKKQTAKILANGYNNLSTNQVKKIMRKYNANYFLTNSQHYLALKIAYQDNTYILYTKSN